MDMKEALAKLIKEAVDRAVKSEVLAVKTLPDFVLEVPPQKEFGDYAVNIAMVLAKQAKKPPRFIAEAVMAHMPWPEWLEKAEIAGPGFINFYLKTTWLFDALSDVIKAGETFGRSTVGQGEKVQLEFVSANPTGPLHVGHGRGAVVGSVLANVMAAAGFAVAKEFYINDAGNQADCLVDSVLARYLQIMAEQNGDTCKVSLPENGYHGRDIIELAAHIMESHVTVPEFLAKGGGGDLAAISEEIRGVFKDLALRHKLDVIKHDLGNFGVDFDVWFSERALHDAGAIQLAVQDLRAKGIIYEKDGALWLKSMDYGDDKDRVVIRENGAPTYLAADIAYHRDKFQRGFDRVINLWGADHHGYILRMKAAVEAMGYRPDQLEVLILQMVNLYQNV